MVENITDEQLAHYKECFTTFDKDEDGYLQADELAYVIRSLGNNPTKKELEDTLNEYDEQKKGMLDFKGFLRMVVKLTKAPETPDQIINAFRIFDRENNGALSVAELRHALTTAGECLTDDEVDTLIKLADPDGEGFVRYEDFVKNFMSS